MTKKLIDRLIIVADNLRDIEGDLMRAYGKQYPSAQILIGGLGIELDILDSIIDTLIVGWERKIKNREDES